MEPNCNLLSNHEVLQKFTFHSKTSLWYKTNLEILEKFTSHLTTGKHLLEKRVAQKSMSKTQLKPNMDREIPPH
jgi:hypothetical protein